MSYKGTKAEIKIIDAAKFTDSLPINVKNLFNGTLYYDEQGYGNNNSNLTLKQFGGYVEEVSNNLKFDMSNSKKYKKCMKEYEEYDKNVNEDTYVEGMLDLMLGKVMVGEECDVYLNDSVFKGIIIDIGQSRS